MKKMMYSAPAQDWNSALPLGNGRLGAMIFGIPDKEIVQLNEESIWSGFYQDRNNKSCKNSLTQIRSLIKEGKVEKAQDLMFQTMTGNPQNQRVYQTAGNLNFEFCLPGKDAVTGPMPNRNDGYEFGLENGRPDDVYAERSFMRYLDLETAVSGVSFTAGGCTFTREYFITAVDDVILMKFSADKKGMISFRCSFDRGIWSDANAAFDERTILLEDSHGIPFCLGARAIACGGTLTTRGNCLIAEGADAVVLFIDCKTAYRSVGGNDKEKLRTECLSSLDRIYNNIRSGRTWVQMKADHIADYQQYFNRLDFCLEQPDPSQIVLYYNFCRYLLISCSRPGTLPATLQGLWNYHIDPPWGSKYTININTEMNYWPASMCALGEMEMPLFDLLKKAYANGCVTAHEMYGCGGWLAHHNLDIWGDTAPQDSWLPGTYWVLGAAWLCTHIREQYEYSLDIDFLRSHYYLMHESCRFFSEYLIEGNMCAPDGKPFLVLSPSVSPENTYTLGNGQKAAVCAGCEMDNRILEHLFSAAITSAKDLRLASGLAPDCGIGAIGLARGDGLTGGIGLARGDGLTGGIGLADGKAPDCGIGGEDFAADIERFQYVLDHLAPPSVSAEGTIREWMDDVEETEPGHRHVSQLYGLFPGITIDAVRTPDLAEAACRTLDKRLAHGGGHTGWSRAWIINFRASLHQGEAALENVRELLKTSTLPNLFDNHPPFQIDGNFGALAGITRMIVQSRLEDDGSVHIDLLPALPKEWAAGHVRGVRIKGGLGADIEWKDGKMFSFSLYNQKYSSTKPTAVKKITILNVKAAIQVFLQERSMNVLCSGTAIIFTTAELNEVSYV